MDRYQLWAERYRQAGAGADTPASDWERQYGADTVRIWGQVRIASGNAVHHPDTSVVLVFRRDGEVPLKLYRRW